MADYVGVDLGASKILVAVGTVGNVRGRARRPTPPGPSGIDVTEAVLDTVRSACDHAGVDPTQIAAGAIGSIGPFDLATGMIVNPANLPTSVDRIPLTGPLANLIESDAVELHNDTTAAVIGERYVASENPDDMVYLTISTGIGAGISVDGHVLTGWDGNAGEVGHITVDPTGRLTCGCGRDGHWEAYASGGGIPRYARFLAEEHGTDTILPLADDDFTAADVFDAHGHDELADTVLESVGRWNAIGVANIVHAFAPLVISVGGSVAIHNESAVLDPLREALPALVMSNVPDIRLSSLGEEAVVIGALASAMTDGTGTRSGV